MLGIPLLLSQFQPYCIAAFLATAVFLSANISVITLHPSIIFVGLYWFVSIGMHLGIF